MTAGFAHQGGMVNLERAGKRLKFEINRAAVQRHGLKVSHKILKLATLIEDDSMPSSGSQL